MKAVLDSRLTPAEALERLGADVFRTVRGTPNYPFAPPDGFALVGRVGPGRVSLSASRGMSRNPFRPVLRGRVEPHGEGSRFTGRIGPGPAAALAVLASLIGVTVVAVADGDFGVAGIIGVCAAALFFLGVAALGTYVARSERLYLQDVLQDRFVRAHPHEA